MAEPEVVEKNPFDGMTFGQATLKLKAQPELASKFDALFKDEEEYDALERARLHHVNSYYRGTTAGASWLQNISMLIGDKEIWKNAEPKGVSTSPYLPGPILPTQKDLQDQYAAVIEDLAKYERMKPADGWKDFAAAIGGSIAGSIPSPESLLRLPIPLVGQKPIARIAEGALQGGVINAATDPLVQEMNIGAGVQKEFDWTQTALAGPLGAVVGGGLVGVGQVISKTLAKKTWQGMAIDDPQARTFDAEPVSAIREAKDEKKVEVAKGPEIKAPESLEEGTGFDKALTPKATKSTELRDSPLTAGNAHEIQLLDAEGTPHYRIELQDSGTEKIWTVGYVENMTRQFKGQGAELYKEAAKFVEEQGGRLVSGFDASSDAKRVQQQLVKQGVAVKIDPVTFFADPELQMKWKDADLYWIRPNILTDEAALKRPPLTKGGQINEQQRPDQGIPFSGEEHTVKSQQRLVQDLERDFDVDIRQGRVTMENALATYNTRTGIIHTKEYSDFEVATHETAHAIHEQMIKLGFDDFLRRHDAELRLLDYDQDPIFGQRYFEGFAEWVRYFVGNPAAATRKAPGFTGEFLNFMETKNPEYLVKLIDAAANYQEYLTASSLDVLRASTKQTDKRGRFERITDTLEQEGLPKTIGNYLSKAYNGSMDHASAMSNVLRAMSRDFVKRNGKLMQHPGHDLNPEMWWRKVQRSGQTAQDILRNGTIKYGTYDNVGASMRDVFLAAHKAHSDLQSWDQKLMDDFNVYVAGREALERWSQYNRGEIDVPPHPMKDGDIKQAVADLDDMYPQFYHASQLYLDFNRTYVRERMLPAGLKGITPEFVARIEKQDFYAPFRRDVSDRPLAGEGDKDSAVVKAFKGSSRDVLAPLEQTALFVERVERMIIENETIRGLVAWSKAAGEAGGRYVEPIGATEVTKTVVDLENLLDKELAAKGVSATDRVLLMSTITNMVGPDPLLGNVYQTIPTRPRGEPIVFYSEDGVQKAVRIISEKEDPQIPLYETLTAMPNYQRDASLKVMAATSNFLSRSIVVEPVFQVGAFLRDQLFAAMYIPGYIPFVSAVRGAWAEYTQNETARLYRAAGGVSTHHNLLGDEEAARASIDALAKKGYFIERIDSLSGLAQIVTSLEMATRLSAFDKVRRAYIKQGVSDYDATNLASREATDLYDMGRYGSKLQTMRAMTPFLSPYLQGLDKISRSSFEPILRQIFRGQTTDLDPAEARKAWASFGKIMAIGPGLGFGWAAMNWHDENYRDARPDVKGKNFIMTIGDRVIIAPKHFEASIPFTLGEYMFASLMHNDPRAGEGMIKASFDVLQPPIPFYSNPIIRTTSEAFTNTRVFDWSDVYDGMFNKTKPIVPERMKGMATEEQYTPKTSEIAKRISKITGISPIKTDYMIGGYFGTWGKYVAQFSNGLESDSEARMLEENAFYKRFSRDPAVISGAVEQFWNYMGRTAGKFSVAVTTYNQLGALNDNGTRQQAFYNKLAPNEKAWVILQRGANPDDPSKLAFKPEDRQIHPFSRAKDAVTVLNTLRIQTEEARLKDSEGKPIVLPQPVRKAVAETLSKMAMMEMRNALTITKEPGYADRPLHDLGAQLEILKVRAPEVAKEVIQQYANKKIYRTGDVANSYDRLRDELLTNGSRADLGVITDFVKQGGYEFGGERVTIRPRRSVIPGGR